MAKFIIPCSWEMYGKIEIEANTLQEAIEKANEAPLPEGNYVDSSFEVDTEVLYDENIG